MEVADRSSTSSGHGVGRQDHSEGSPGLLFAGVLVRLCLVHGMVRHYTPEERAERRRRSSVKKDITPLVDDDGGDGDLGASWMADLRSQGVDVEEFLKAARPDTRGGGSNRSLGGSEGSKRIPTARESSIQSLMSNQSGTDGSSSSLARNKSSFHGKSDDMAKKAVEKMSDEQWQEVVGEDSRSYDPSHTSEEEIKQAREWAIKMAHKRAAQAGFKPATETNATTDDDSSSMSANKTQYPKIGPPPIQPLPPLDEDDFNSVSEPPLNPKELGIFPPSLPHSLSDLVPKASKKSSGIVDGLVIHGTSQEVWESCDSDSMVALCTNDQCNAFLYCPRNSSLIRCEKCNAVSPACPLSSVQISDAVYNGYEAPKRRGSFDTNTTLTSLGLESAGTERANVNTSGMNDSEMATRSDYAFSHRNSES